MKQLIAFMVVSLVFGYNVKSQNTITPAPMGFDIMREGIPHGNIDTIIYNSKTVGNKRKALIYTPPDYLKEKNYPVIKDSEHRAIAGLSMGGIQTLYAGVNNTDMFSYLGVFSSGWFANQKELSDPQYVFMKINADKINGNLTQFWISQGGKEDIAWKNCQEMLLKFDEMKIR